MMLPRFSARQSLAAGVGAVCFPTAQLGMLSLTRVFRVFAVGDQPGPLGSVQAGPNPWRLRPVPAKSPSVRPLASAPANRASGHDRPSPPGACRDCTR